MKLFALLLGFLQLFASTIAIPAALLYDYINVEEALILPKGDDISSNEVFLEVPVTFFGTPFDSIFVNNNGFLSFQSAISHFINIEFPLDYPIIAPFYSNVDTRQSGTVSCYETSAPSLLDRATKNVQESFSKYSDFEALNLFIATWHAVGYYDMKADKVNTFQVVIISNGEATFVEFLYPENGLQWIQGTGDESGLPDARAQAAIISPDGKLFSLPGSGSEVVRNLEKWSNIKLNGQFIYKVDGNSVEEPDIYNQNGDHEERHCVESPTACHNQAKCIDYDAGFCCECKGNYYGNGKFCVKKDVPLRVNGKVNGLINGERLDNLDLQSYIVMSDGRAYTAVSKIPISLNFDVQSLQILGATIGYLFAKPIRSAVNGYQLTGGVFNHTATITFHNTSQVLRLKQKYYGLDVFDQLRADIDLQGQIPALPAEARVEIDEYQEQYTMTQPGVVQSASSRVLKYNSPMDGNDELVLVYNVEQTFVFDYCKFENKSVGESWKLRVGKNFISYESKEQLVRFGLSNKATPIGDFDPCEEGRSQCMQNSACVIENDSFRCVCNPGYQQIHTGSEQLCSDIDECRTGLHECDYNAECINQIGGYSCQCYPGFEGNGHYCENAHSCQNIRCNENAECVQVDNVASCRCLKGFTGDGQVCVPIIDQSCHINNNCSPYGLCVIDPDSNEYECRCLPGHQGDGYRCVKVEEPSSTTLEAILATTIESTDCNTLYNCHSAAQCLYIPTTGTFQCVCNAGYEGSGSHCDPEQLSCSIHNNCHPDATCTYDSLLGKSTCNCNEGYDGDGYNCNLALANNCHCGKNEKCHSNNIECICKDGFVRDSQNQCVFLQNNCGGGTCVANAECLFDDEHETNYCTCRSGFIGDGITECNPKPIGCDVLHNCHVHAYCFYNSIIQTHQCKCVDGFKGDGMLCYKEIDCNIDPTLCDSNADCITMNLERKFDCRCRSGFVGNGTVCNPVAKYEGNVLLLNQGMATLKVSMDERNRALGKPIQIRLNQIAVGLDFDCLEGRIFWSDINGRAIRSSLFNGGDKKDFVKSVGSPEGLAVDWVSRNLYFTDSTNDTIEVINLDSRRRRTLISSGLVNPRGIAVHPQRGKIFWSDWNRKDPKIEWANADGTGRQIFLSGSTVTLLPNSLTIDFEEEKLCFADAGTKRIECVHIDTRVRETIATNCTYPFGIAVTDQHVYWSDWTSKAIERVEKYSLKRLSPLKVPLGGSGNKRYGLVAVPMKCPQLTNVCQNNKCRDGNICLPNGSGSRTCACAYISDSSDENSTSC